MNFGVQDCATMVIACGSSFVLISMDFFHLMYLHFPNRAYCVVGCRRRVGARFLFVFQYFQFMSLPDLPFFWVDSLFASPNVSNRLYHSYTYKSFVLGTITARLGQKFERVQLVYQICTTPTWFNFSLGGNLCFCLQLQACSVDFPWRAG